MVAAFPSFTRLSIDQIIYDRHGSYTVNYAPERYDEYQTEADEVYDTLCQQLLREGRDIVLDRSFYVEEDRDEFKNKIEQARAKWVLAYFKVEKNVLWERLCERRSRGVNADSALEISEELLAAYVKGSEVAVGEGATVIEVQKRKCINFHVWVVRSGTPLIAD